MGRKLDGNSLASGSCGLSDGSSAGDCRLPNFNQLRSLVDLDEDHPVLPAGHPFTGVSWGDYGSSSSNEKYPSSAWAVIMGSGVACEFMKVDLNYVWLVRGGN